MGRPGDSGFGGRGRGGGRGGFSNGRGGGDRSSFGSDRGGFRGGRGGGGNRSFGSDRGGSRGGSRGGFRGGSRGGPRGGSRGGAGGMRGGKRVIVLPHERFPGIFLVKGKEDALATKNIVPGESIYGEKRVSVPAVEGVEGGETIEYRVWNPFRSKLGAAVVAGTENIHIAPGSKVLYLGAASGTTVSHVSDIVGPEGIVYAVEFSHRSGRDLLAVAKKRPNVVPIVDDARMPQKYSMIVGIVDVIFSDVAQPDQARIVALNAHKFLKNGGFCVISIKASCVDSTSSPEAVFASEVEKLRGEQFTPREQCTLEPYERNHAIVVAEFKVAKKSKKEQ